MAMITLELTEGEQKILINLLDGACRHFGGAAAQGVAHFQNKLMQAAQKEKDVRSTTNNAPDHQSGPA
jgi:hypothetical protein